MDDEGEHGQSLRMEMTSYIHIFDNKIDLVRLQGMMANRKEGPDCGDLGGSNPTSTRQAFWCTRESV